MWKVQNELVNMRLYLDSMDLFEFANGSAVPPAADATEAVRRTFANRAKKAWTYICLAVEPEQQSHIRDTTTANAAWNTLKNQYVRILILQKVRLRQQYYSSRFETGGNMLEHLNHMKSLHDQLREMGCTMDDKELAMTVLLVYQVSSNRCLLHSMLLVKQICHLRKSKECC